MFRPSPENVVAGPFGALLPPRARPAASSGDSDPGLSGQQRRM